jgi:hypothetical protein
LKWTNRLFRDRERLIKMVMRELQRDYVIRRYTGPGGRPAKAILAERLAALPDPEFCLLAAYILRHDVDEVFNSETHLWLKTLQNDWL